MSLGARIQQHRKSSKLSQEQLGEIVGVSRQAVSKWESDQTAPEIDKVRVLCKQFAITMDELLDYTPPPTEEAEEESSAAKAEDAAEAVAVQLQNGAQLVAQPGEMHTRANMKKRQFTVGWVTALIGIILMVVEYFSLFLVQYFDFKIATASGSRWYTDALYYAKMDPMPLIFTVTKIVIAVGVFVAISGFVGMRVPKTTQQ